MATFITSKAVGQTINITVQTSTGYWKYNHNGTDSNVFEHGPQTITVANANGEFVIISCLSDGTVSGNITYLDLSYDQLTTFDGTGLSSLTYLGLQGNQLTSFDGTGLSSLTQLFLSGNGLTSFDGTGLSSLTSLNLTNNPLTTFIGGDMSLITGLNFQNWNITTLTSFDGTGLSTLTGLQLNNNQLTTFDGTELSSLTELNLNNNQLTEFDGTGLSGLTVLNLEGNGLTSFNGTGLSSLTYLSLLNNGLTSLGVLPMTSLTELYLADTYGLNDNPITDTANNTILLDLVTNGNPNGNFYTTGGRTADGTADYDALIGEGWNLLGLDLYVPPTFITSKAVGQTINITVQTSTGYWKSLHNGTETIEGNGVKSVQVLNTNGEFTITSCLSDGTVSGDITELGLQNKQITSFNGTGLSGLTYLNLEGNQLTSFDGAGLSNLTILYLTGNGLTTFDGTDLTSLNLLGLGSIRDKGGSILASNNLTSFDGTGLSSLTTLNLQDNPLTTFIGGDMGLITELDFTEWDITTLTSFDGTGLSGLTQLYLTNNPLTTFIGGDMGLITSLDFYGNWNITTLETFTGTGLSGLTYLSLLNNGLTSLGVLPMTSLTELYLADTYGLNGNPMTDTANDTILSGLVTNGNSGGNFYTSGGRTADGTADYNTLIGEGWNILGADLVIPPLTPTFITSNLTGETINIDIETSEGFWKYYHDGVWSEVYDSGTYAGSFEIEVTAEDGEFTLTSCDDEGTISGDITYLDLTGNGLTSFDGTPLTSLAQLILFGNGLTSFDGTGLSSLTDLDLGGNQLTSFNGTGLSGLTDLSLKSNGLTSFNGTGLSGLVRVKLDLSDNPLTTFIGGDMGLITELNFSKDWGITTLETFDGTGLSGLTELELAGNQLTSLDVLPMTSLINLYLTDPYGLNGNPMTATANNTILLDLVTNGQSGGNFYTSGGRTTDGTADYDALIGEGWNILGADLVIPPLTPTFITNKNIGEFINIDIETSEGFWKYYHDGVWSEVYDSGTYAGSFEIEVTAEDGEFTLTSCDDEGTVSGDITELELNNNGLTSFDGTVLSGLTYLGLQNNQLTGFTGTGLSSLTYLNLGGPKSGVGTLTSVSNLPVTLTILVLNNNQLTSFDGTGLSSLTSLILDANQLTTFDGTPLSSLTELELNNNGLTTFDGTGLSSLTNLYLSSNSLTTFIGGDMGLITTLDFPGWNITTLTSFDGTGLSSLAQLILYSNQLTSFDGTGLSGLSYLDLSSNALASFDGTDLIALVDLYLVNNGLTSLDVLPMTSLSNLYLTDPYGLNGNPMTAAANNTILSGLVTNGGTNGYFYTSGGRTSAGTADYDELIANNWNILGADLIAVVRKLRVKGIGQQNQ